MNNYENRIVLFLDILGFKKIINETIKKSKKSSPFEVVDKTTFIIETIREMTNDAEISHKKSSKVVSQFSDSIVISFKADDQKELPNLFYNLQRLIAKLIARKVLCRGAISYGLLYHKNNLVFGPALVDAFETESQAALYPRVILDKSVIEIMKYHYSFENKHSFRKITFDVNVDSFLKTDTDDKFYVDYFIGTMMFFKEEEMYKIYSDLRKMIMDGLRYKNPSINIKYGWMKNKYNKLKESLELIDKDEELFYKRPDIKKFYDDFKPITT